LIGANYIFIEVKKTLYMTIGPIGGGIHWKTFLKHSSFQNLLIYSDREKISASNEPNIKGHIHDIDELLGQKLIFQSFENVQDIAYYPANLEKKYDIRNQHTSFYRSVQTINGKMTKNFFRIPGGYPRQKKTIFYEIWNKVVENDPSWSHC
jgi:hypothetical protein